MITAFLAIFAMCFFPDSILLLATIVVVMFGTMLIDLVIMNVIPWFKNRK